MTEVEKLTGATPYLGTYWKSINWKKVQAEVRRLQMRIAKAAAQKKWNKVKSLQMDFDPLILCEIVSSATSYFQERCPHPWS